MANIYMDGGKTFSNAPAEYSGNSICLGGYGIPIFNREIRKLSDGENDFSFQDSFRAPNRQVKEFELTSLFRVSEYNFYDGFTQSGVMSWIRDSGEARGLNNNFELGFKAGPFRNGTMTIYCPKPYSNAAFMQLFYHYDEWTANSPNELVFDSFGDVVGFTGVYTYFPKAAEIWNRYQVTWTFYDYDMSDNGIIHYPRKFQKMLAWPFYDSCSRYTDDPNLPPYTGNVPELRYYTSSRNPADTGTAEFPVQYSPFRIFRDDAIRIPLSYCKDVLLSAASGWDIILHNPHFNQIHPSWPWVMPLSSMESLQNAPPFIDATVDHCLPFSNLFQVVNGLYYGNPFIFGTAQGTGSFYENIPMPAMDPAVSFQLNNLNSKPTGWISFNDYEPGVSIPYASGGGPLYELVHQINSPVPLLTNIFAKQANEPHEYSGAIGVRIGGASFPVLSGEINLPRIEYINAHINFSTIVPKEVPISINLTAESATFPVTFHYTKGTGTEEFEFDWNFIAYPTGQLKLLFRNINGTVIDYPDYFTRPSTDGRIHPLSGINHCFSIPLETGFTIPTGYPITGFTFSNYQTSGEPMNDYFYHLIGGVDMSGMILIDDPFRLNGQNPNATSNWLQIDQTVGRDDGPTSFTFAFHDPFQPIEDSTFFHTTPQGMILSLRTGWFFLQESGLFNAIPSGGFNVKRISVASFSDLIIDGTIEIDGIDVPLIDNLPTFTYPFSRATAILNFTGF